MKAKESHQVEKARKKLAKKIAKEDQEVTTEALAKMSHIIERQLFRHASERIDLKSKEIQLFDQNRHPAAVKSRFISQLLNEIKAEISEEASSLKGRITSSN